MKKIFVFLLILMFCCLPSYAQIWEGSGGQLIDEGIGFGNGSGGGSIDWSEFTGDKCTITFQTYDGSSPAQSAVVPVGVPSSYVMQDIDEPTKAGYIFGGWSLLEDYPTPVEIPNNFIATTTYYAIFTKTRYTVYYNNPDNSQYTSQTYEYNEEIVEPTEPTYTNDYFWDWDNLPDEMPAATFTVKAQVFPKTTIAYGLEVDLDAVSSATAYTYLYDAVGMTPVFVDNDGVVNNFGDSATSWKSFVYQYVKPCMLKLDGTVDYYLDPEDQSKKLDGTASDISNASYDGNAMVEFGKLWTNAKNIKGTHKYRLIISPNEINNVTYAEAFKRADGTYADKAYYSMFQAGWNQSRAVSVSTFGKDTTANMQTIRQRAQANGNGWDVTYEALTQHIYKLVFMIGKTVEPTGILFQKKHINYVADGVHNSNNNAYGISNGCFYVQGNTNNLGLIKILWINDFTGNNVFFQTGFAYYNKKVMLKYPPFSEQGTVDGFIEIGDLSSDLAYISNYSSPLHYTRLGFFKGIAYENKFATASADLLNSAVLGHDQLLFLINNNYRNNNFVMPSFRNFPNGNDRLYTTPTSTSYHHCGWNGNSSLPNNHSFTYRLAYIEPSNNKGKTLLNSKKSEKSREYLFSEPPKQVATPSTDIGETR